MLHQSVKVNQSAGLQRITISLLIPEKMIRVIVAVGQNRGRLRNAYNALRGRDARTGEMQETLINQQLDLLKSAQATALNPTNWDDFLRVLRRAGFRSRKMITSNNTVLYTYALWLIGLTKFNLDRSRLRSLMARWFFMSQTTGRYTNSPETSIEEDLSRFDTDTTDPETFADVIERIIATTLTGDFWTIRLPDDFITSSTFVSPAYQAYVASLNILDADLFLLDEKVRDWMDPSAATARAVEGHHLFPRGYLIDAQSITSTKRINQVANIAPTDWATNNLISNRPPHEYWPELLASRNLAGDKLNRQQYWHRAPTTLGIDVL